MNGKEPAKMPEKVQFTNYHRQLHIHFTFYIHLEANLKDDEEINRNTPDGCYTSKYQCHIACGSGYKLVEVDYRL